MAFPYEASTIYATLFAFGFEYAQSKPTDGVAFSGFQQTPLDALFGDATFQSEGRHVLVEFKRDRASVESEYKKPHRARLLAELQDAPRDTQALSSRAHWLIFGGDDGIQCTPYRLLPLLAKQASTITVAELAARFLRTLDDPTPEAGHTSRSSWREQVGYRAHGAIGVSRSDMLAYLQLVFDAETDDAASTADAVGGFWLTADLAGHLVALPFRDDAQLRQLRDAVSAGGGAQPSPLIASPPPPYSPNRRR